MKSTTKVFILALCFVAMSGTALAQLTGDTNGDGIADVVTAVVGGVRVVHGGTGTTSFYPISNASFSLNTVEDTDGIPGDEIVVIWAGNVPSNGIQVIHDRTGATKNYQQDRQFGISFVSDTDGEAGNEIIVYWAGAVPSNGIQVIHDRTGATKNYQQDRQFSISISDTDGEAGNEIIVIWAGTVPNNGIQVIHDRTGGTNNYQQDRQFSISSVSDTDGEAGNEIIVIWAGTVPNNGIQVIHDRTGGTNNYQQDRQFSIQIVSDLDSVSGAEICVSFFSYSYAVIIDRTQNTIATSGCGQLPFQSATTGNWSSAETWVRNRVPGAGDDVVIASGYNVTLDVNPVARTITVNSGGTLTVSGNPTLSSPLTVEGTLNLTGTLTNNDTTQIFGACQVAGTLTNNGKTQIEGTFQLDQGGSANGNDFTYGTNGTLVFNNSSGSYGVNSGDVYWPTANGPAYVIVQGAGGITMNVVRAVSGFFQTAAGIMNANNLTFSGTVQINAGGFFDSSPLYSGDATLVYSTGGTYNVGPEWGSGTNVGQGVPRNIVILNSTTVNMPGTPRTCPGNLSIGGYLNGETGTLVMNTTSGADLSIGGTFLNTDGTFVPNSRVVVFNGDAEQSIITQATFDYLTINNSAGIRLPVLTEFGCLNITVNQTLTFLAGNFTLEGCYLILQGAVVGASTSRHIVTPPDGGWVSRTMMANESFQFPVGPTATSYNPLTIALDPADPTETFSVRVDSTVNPSAPDDSLCVQRTWDISEATGGDNHAALTFQWAGAEEGAKFTRNASSTYLDDFEVAQNGVASGTDPYIVSTTGGFPCTEFSRYVVGRSGGTAGITPVTSSPRYPISAEFVVDIMVTDVTNLFGVSFELNYTNTAYIDVVTPTLSNVLPGPFMGNDVVFAFNVDETSGKIGIGVSRKLGQSGGSGSGVVASIRFKSLLSTPPDTQVELTLTNVSASDSSGAAILLPASSHTITIYGQAVWPGDTNNDQIANQADVLPLGLHWSRTGLPRDRITCEWNGHAAIPWSPEAATYADANGDGAVNQADVLCIGLNWGKTHTALQAIADESDQSMILSKTAAATIGTTFSGNSNPGEDFEVEVVIDQVVDLFGASFELLYAPATLLDPQATEAGSLMGNDVIFFPHVDKNAGKISIGVSRKAGQGGVTGKGAVAKIKMHVSSQAVRGQTITLTLQNVTANDPAGQALLLSIVPGSPVVVSVASPLNATLPTAFMLQQNSPNPFNPTTEISYDLPEASEVRIEIFDMLGKRVRTLVNQRQIAGSYSVIWDSRDANGQTVASGVYLYQLRAGTFSQTRRMALLR